MRTGRSPARRFRRSLGAMLADHDAGVEVVVEPGAGTHAALRGLDRYTQSPLAMRRACRCGSSAASGWASCGPAEIKLPPAVLGRVDPILYSAQAIDNTRILRDHRGDLRKNSVQRLIQALHHGFVAQDDRGQQFHIVAQAGDFGCQPLQCVPDIGQSTISRLSSLIMYRSQLKARKVKRSLLLPHRQLI